MKTTTKTAKPKAAKPKKRTLTEALVADAKARRKGETVSTLTPAERRELLAQNRKWTAEHAISSEAAESDVLAVLFAAAIEFARKYYPGTTQGTLHLSNREAGDRGFSLSLPFPLPPATPSVDTVKTVVRDYATATHPGWETANVGIILGQREHGDTERSELLLIDNPANLKPTA
jgi:hypothetical protein